MTDLDEQDRAILRHRQVLLDARPRIGEGDFLRFPDGTYRRVAHDWGDAVQPTVGPTSACAGDESFHLSEGYASFSGGLDHAIPMDRITATGETREGAVWIFHHNYPRAGGAVRCKATFKVFAVRPEDAPGEGNGESHTAGANKARSA